MGAEPYYYFVPYQPDVAAALQALRRREFEAGRYNPVMPFLVGHFPIGPDSPAPGPRHGSIAKALEAADADGTRSILDIEGLSDAPELGVAVKLSDQALTRLYGSTRPTRAQVEADMDFFEDLERGHAVYVVLYEGDAPSEILFAGFSVD